MVAVEATRAVELRALPVESVIAAEEAMDDLLRELQLVLLATPAAGIGAARSGAPAAPERFRPDHEAELAVAARLDAAARGFESGRRQLREQVSAAAARGDREVTVVLQLPASAGRAAADYRDAVEQAALLEGQLLAAVDGTGVARRPAPRLPRRGRPAAARLLSPAGLQERCTSADGRTWTAPRWPAPARRAPRRTG